uniref:C2H2-type domain-containing protein n=1 Tax=Aureoumbra lagunensis TaxID=44058 RepID=A0A7S3NNB0_9STRA
MPCIKILKFEEALSALKARAKSSTNDDDDDVHCMNSSIELMLTDPFSLQRLNRPCRGREWKHDQYFNLSSYLSWNSTRVEPLCPVCQAIVTIDDVLCDELVARLLQELPSDIVKVIINTEDFTFSYTSENNHDLQEKTKLSNEIIDLTGDSDIDDSSDDENEVIILGTTKKNLEETASQLFTHTRKITDLSPLDTPLNIDFDWPLKRVQSVVQVSISSMIALLKSWHAYDITTRVSGIGSMAANSIVNELRFGRVFNGQIGSEEEFIDELIKIPRIGPQLSRRLLAALQAAAHIQALYIARRQAELQRRQAELQRREAELQRVDQCENIVRDQTLESARCCFGHSYACFHCLSVHDSLRALALHIVTIHNSEIAKPKMLQRSEYHSFHATLKKYLLHQEINEQQDDSERYAFGCSFVCFHVGCLSGFQTVANLQNHVLAHHNGVLSKPRDLKEIDRESLDLYLQIYAQREESERYASRPFVCFADKCLTDYTSCQALKKHVLNQHAGILAPAKEPKAFCPNVIMKSSIGTRFCAFNEEFVCFHSSCLASFLTKKKLNKHFKAKHDGVRSPVRDLNDCDPILLHPTLRIARATKIATENSADSEKYMSHKYVCYHKQCRYIFSSLDLLASHTNDIHNGHFVKPHPFASQDLTVAPPKAKKKKASGDFICSICQNRSFKLYSSLKQHWECKHATDLLPPEDSFTIEPPAKKQNLSQVTESSVLPQQNIQQHLKISNNTTSSAESTRQIQQQIIDPPEIPPQIDSPAKKQNVSQVTESSVLPQQNLQQQLKISSNTTSSAGPTRQIQQQIINPPEIPRQPSQHRSLVPPSQLDNHRPSIRTIPNATRPQMNSALPSTIDQARPIPLDPRRRLSLSFTSHLDDHLAPLPTSRHQDQNRYRHHDSTDNSRYSSHHHESRKRSWNDRDDHQSRPYRYHRHHPQSNHRSRHDYHYEVRPRL